MIELEVEDYCHGCGEFEPECEKLYANGGVFRTSVTCVNATKCRNLKNYLDRTTPKPSEKIYTKGMDCRTCKWSYNNSGCDKGRCCRGDICQLHNEGANGVFCKCSMLNVDDPCPWYEEDTE